MEPLGRKVIGPGCGDDWFELFVGWHHVDADPDDEVVRRHAGEIDAGEVARFAVATVGADEVLGRQVVGAVGAGDVDRDVVITLFETGQGVTPTDVGGVVVGPSAERLDKALLLYRDDEQLGVRHRRELQWKARKHGVWRWFWRIGRTGERAVQASVIQDPSGLA